MITTVLTAKERSVQSHSGMFESTRRGLNWRQSAEINNFISLSSTYQVSFKESSYWVIWLELLVIDGVFLLVGYTFDQRGGLHFSHLTEAKNKRANWIWSHDVWYQISHLNYLERILLRWRLRWRMYQLKVVNFLVLIKFNSVEWHHLKFDLMTCAERNSGVSWINNFSSDPKVMFGSSFALRFTGLHKDKSFLQLSLP